MSGQSGATARFAALLVAVLVAAGCGGAGDDAAPTTTTDPRGTPLTDEQADVLAQLFFRNHEDGGAAFEAEIPAGAGTSATLTGEVDWVGHVAGGTYQTEGGATPLGGAEYVWNPTIVLDGSIPGLEQAMAAEQGRDGVTWVSRPLDPTEVPLDGVLALVHTISSDRPGNPQVIAGQDAAYLGRSTEGGEQVDRYRFGDNTVYVVGVDDGRLRRVEATFRSIGDTVDLTLTDRGARRVASPQRDAVVDASTIPEIYRRLTGRDAPTDPTPPPATPTSTGG